MRIIGASSHRRYAILLVMIWCQGISFAQQAAVSPTVVAVQGDLFDSVDMASKFLTGCRRNHPTETYDSCQKSTYHVPDDWSNKNQIHLDGTESNYSRFYRDKRVKDEHGKPGEDESPTHGLEQAQIVFYAGHGGPEKFCAVEEETVRLGDFSLGDASTRYLFMLSCNVFAHGPRSKAGDFNTPHLFDAALFQQGQALTGAESEMANVFHSWGTYYGDGRRPPLQPSLQLACGGSSRIGGAREYGTYPTHLFWYYSSVLRLNPADSWLAGLYVPGKAEPLCMSRGDSLKDSGLADPWFQVTPPAEGTTPPEEATPPDFIYAEYPMEGRADDPLVQAATSSVAAKSAGLPQPRAETCFPVYRSGLSQPRTDAAVFPVLEVAKTALPSVFNVEAPGFLPLKYGFQGGAASVVAGGLLPALFPPSLAPGDSVIRAEDICVEKNPASGSVAISWRPDAAVVNQNTESDLDAAATDFLLRLMKLFEDVEQQAPSGKEQKASVQGVTAIQMRIDRVKAGSLLAQPDPLDGCLYLRQTRSVDAGQGMPVRIFGEGSETFIGRCPAAAIRLEPQTPPNPCERKGSPLATFAYANRRITKVEAVQPKAGLRRTDAVIQEARSKLGLPTDQADRYTSVDLRKGYRAAPVHCAQGRMYLVYQVDFTSDDPYLLPRTVEVLAQDLGEAITIEDTWEECSAE